MGSIALGLVAGAVCFFFCSTVKNALGYDDSLDVFGIHGVGGIIGAIGTGILVNPALGGAGIPDYISNPGTLSVAPYEFSTAVMAQIKAVLFTIVWTGIGSAIIYKIVDVVIGLRVPVEQEREGLDLADHGERAYNY
jgi:Amt family ammonium transporter